MASAADRLKYSTGNRCSAVSEITAQKRPSRSQLDWRSEWVHQAQAFDGARVDGARRTEQALDTERAHERGHEQR